MRRVTLDHAPDTHHSIFGVRVGTHLVEVELNVLNCMRKLVGQDQLPIDIIVVPVDDRNAAIAATVVSGNRIDPVLDLRFGEALGSRRNESHQTQPARLGVLTGEVFEVDATAHLLRVLFD